MSNTNIEDVTVQLTETRNELSEGDLRLWDGLENERVSRIAGDDANKSLTLQVQDSVSGTERRLSTEVIHREQGDLDKLGLLNQLSQSMSAYRIKTDKEIEAERFARDILGINLDARITTAEASFNHKELKLYQDIQEVFTDLDGKYTSMDARIKKYEDMLQDITMDSIKITMDNGEINMGAWTILSQAREWDLEILAKMRGFQEKTNEDVNQALEELQNQLPITENIINEIMENLSESPLISELRDALNESIDTSESLAVRLAKEEAARAQAMIDLAYANAQALAAEKAALAESLAAEAQARADEVQEEADRRIESIRQIRADLEQDVGELNDQVDSIRDGAIADKAGILETVNNYKTELKSDIATVNTELLGALDGVNTLVTEVRGENEVTLNELTTYKTSNDVAVAGLLSKITTNISDTAANASKITGLTTQLATTNTELGTVRNTSANALSKANTAVTANSALATRVDSLAAAITDLGEGAETTVDVYAFNALKAEVVTNSSGITSLVEQVDALGTNYTNLTDGVEANTDAVSTLTVKQSEMNGDISQLSSDVTYLTSELGVINTALNTKASNQALSNLNTKLTTTDGLVAANTQQLTQLNTDLTTVRDGLETKASTEALNNLATGVTELEDGLAVNASAITSLKSEIDTELNKKATVTAVNGLTTKVEEVEGKTTTNANNLLALNTTVGNVVKGLANKLDASAISDYYTKSQTDAKAESVAAGKIEDFSATLVSGGRNYATKLQNGEDLKIFSGSVVTVTPNLARPLMPVTLPVTNPFRVKITGGTNSVIGSASITFIKETKVFIGFKVKNEGSELLRFAFTSLFDIEYLKGSDIVSPGVEQEILLRGTTRSNATVSWRIMNPHNSHGGAYTEVKYLMAEVMAGVGTVPSSWIEPVETVKALIDANSTAIQTTNAEVSRVDNRVTATNSAQTLLEGRVEDVEGDITKKADASALASLTTRVGTVEGQYTTQASDITRLNNSLDTTNVNVGTAQTAAQNAMNAAGAKGKVIFGNTAPAVADRLVQNLWIDTTGNANTPKRWNGSAWVVVTDKVATDAAKAVSDLDTVVKTKADVSALNSLTTKVTDDAKKTAANTNSITTLNSDIVKINNDLATKANASALSDMYTKNEVDDKAAEIAAGEVNKFSANLKIGGDNLFSLSGIKRYAGGSLFDTSLFTVTGREIKCSNKGTNDRIGNAIALVDITQPLLIRFTDVEGGATNILYYRCFASDGTALQAQSTVTGTRVGNVVNIVVPASSIPEGTTTINIGFGGNSTAITITNVMVVNANVMPEWTSSSRDVQNALDANAKAIQITNAEVIKVDDKTISNANSIIKLNSDVTGVKNGLATKANTSALNDYYTKTETNDVATTAAAGEVSKYDANLVIGGSNLQDNADFKTTSLNRWAGIYGAVTSIAGGIQYKGTSVSAAARMEKTLTGLEVGQTYTLSVWAKSPVPLEFRGHVNATAIKNIMPEKHDPAVFQRYTCTFIPSVVTGAILRAYVPNTALTAVVIINKEKLEVGSKGTDWSPSSSDIQSSLDANATAISNTNAEVIRVDGRVTTASNQINALTGRVTTVEGSLTTKASVSAMNALTTRVGTVEGGLSTQAQNTTNLTASLAATDKVAKDALPKIGGSGSFKTFKEVLNYYLATSGTANNIVIESPITYVNNMFRISGKGYNYATTKSVIDFDVSGYAYQTNGSILQHGAKNNGTFPMRIRLGMKGGKLCVILSPKGTNFAYPSFTVDATVSYGSVPDTFQTGWTGTQVAEAGLASSGITNIIEPSLMDVGTELEANANAISTTNAEVSRIDGVVKGHVTDIRNLTTSIAGKADSSALSALTVRVTEEEKKSSSQASDITSLTSTANTALDIVTIKDTRSTNQPPSWYWSNYSKRTVNEFKSQTAIGVSGFFGGTYCNLETNIPYGDASGGHIVQTATSSVDPSLYVQRVSTSTTVWGAWKQPIKDLRDTLGTKAAASAVSSLTTEVSRINGVATSAAASTVTLTSRMGNAENALQVQAKVVDGVKANYMVKMETNGVIGGFGLMQSTGVLGSVKTTFGVNANAFFIGAPASKKQPFIVTTTNQVVNGVKYPAGTYIDVALIANATIGNAKISDLNAAKITAGTIDAARIGANSITADKLMVNGGNILYGGLDCFHHFVSTPPNVTGSGSLLLENVAGLFGPKRLRHVSTAVNSYAYLHPTSNSNAGWLKLRSGQRYVLSAYVSTTSTAATTLQLAAVVRAGTTTSAGVGSVTGGVTVKAADGWVRISAAFTAGGTNPHLTYYLRHSSTGITSYWDGFMLEEVPSGVSSPSTFSPGGQTRIDGGTIVANSISADKISAAAIETISLSARNGTFTAADGSKTVINGGLTTVYDSAGKLRMRLGVW